MQAPGQVQRGSREGSGEASGEGLGGCGAEPGQFQQGSGEGSGGSLPGQVQALVQSQVRFNRVLGGFGADPAEVFPALGFTARFGKACKNKRLRLLGIPPKLILVLLTFDLLYLLLALS